MREISPEELAAKISVNTQSGIRNATINLIQEGVLPVGAKLPPLRELAYALGVSQSTVSLAWQDLRQQKVIAGRGRNGTFVTGDNPSPKASRIEDINKSGELRLNLRSAVPDPLLLPNLTEAYSYATTRSYLNTYKSTYIVPELEAGVRHDWPYDAEAFMATDGGYNGIFLALSALVPPKSLIAIENPSSPRLLDIIDSLKLRAVPVSSDDEGPELKSLEAASAQPLAAFVYQPRLHGTTGRYVSAARLAQMGEVFENKNILIIEDDGSGDISPLAPVSVGTSVPRKVLHVKSYSKSHGPDLRIAVMSGSTALIEKIQAFRGLSSPWTSRISQAALSYLLTSARVQESILNARTKYAERRRKLQLALENEGVWAGGEDGLSIFLKVKSETAAVTHLEEFGIAVMPGARCSIDHSDFIRVQTSSLTSNYARIAKVLAFAAELPS